MKLTPKMFRWIPSALVGLTIATLGAASARAQFILNTFDSAAELTAPDNDWNGGSATIAWDGAVDAGGGGSPGSMHVLVPYQNNGPGWQEAQVGRNIPWNNGNYLSLANYINIEFDVKVDVANSYPTISGDWSMARIIVQQWGWTPLSSITITNSTGWQHYSASLSGVSTLAHLLVNFHAGDNTHYPTNQISYWVDNIKLTAPPLPPPTVAISKSTMSSGLSFTPGTSGQYQRSLVYPGLVGSAFGWYGAGQPVSYSFTITNFPTANDFSIQTFLIPNAHLRGGTANNNTSPDWGSTNGTFFTITANGTNPATNWSVQVQTKTNMVTDGSNPNLSVMQFNYDQLPLGKWTLRFDNNTDFTVIAPNGFTTNASLPPDVASLVSGNSVGDTSLTPFIGTMPRTTDHIGKSVVMSRIQITGVSTPVDDTFSTGELDTNSTWNVLADYPAGVFVTPTDLLYTLSWNTPNDQGYQSLDVASSLTGSWQSLLPSSQWQLLNATTPFRRALIKKSDLQAALGNTDAVFFRLAKRVFTKLQILLPGETAAPGTATGKTGTPTAQQAGVPFDVIVRAVDANWYPITSVTDQISLSSAEASFTWTTFPLNMVNGVANFTALDAVSFGAAGSFTIMASDLTDPTKTADTSSSVTVNP
ncbi:MAG: hypothetical protein H7Y43_07350 [Akkermansiaceae bacterium]|nr:hypothetical protein [Verrucomicrobiales bacterium]